MKIEWLSQTKCQLTIDEVEYGLLSFAVVASCEKITLLKSLNEVFLRGLDDRQNLKQKGREG